MADKEQRAINTTQVAVTQEDIRVIRHDVNKLACTLDEVHQAIVGNVLTKDGGLVQRIIDLESEKDDLDKRISIVELKRSKADLYVKIIWGCGGAIISLVTWLLKTK